MTNVRKVVNTPRLRPTLCQEHNVAAFSLPQAVTDRRC